MSASAGLKFIVHYYVPAILVLGGILLLVMGYPLGHADMIRAGWGLILYGVVVYILRIVLYYEELSMKQ